MGGNVGKMIVPLAIGIGAGFAAPALAGSFGAGATAKAGALALSKGQALTAAQTAAMATTQGALATGGFSFMSAMGAGMAANNMMTEVPQQPDFSQQFGEQQAMLTQQQYFGRRSTGELEQMLEFGTDYEKNQAFDELQRRGEDEQRLVDLQTRRGRSEERQGEIDDYIDRNAPPTEDELNILRATLVREEEDKLDADIEAERTRAKQVMARRGMGSSNALSQLNARLEDVRAKGNLAIRNDVNNRVVNYAQGISSLQGQGLQRLMSASSMEDASSRYDLGMQDAERRLQEGLRQSSTASQNELSLNKFRTEVTGMNNAYEQEMQRQQSNAMLGLGAIGIAAPRLWPTATDNLGTKDNPIITQNKNTTLDAPTAFG